jgi:hypothetical protein
MTSWADVLDAFDERIRGLETAARGEGPPPPPATAWEPDDALPAELVPRAHALLARSRTAEAQAERALLRKRAEYADFRRRRWALARPTVA